MATIAFPVTNSRVETMANPGVGERHIIRTLTGFALTPAEAKSVWPCIIEHKWFLSERLGRDVGLRVAAIDYFENIAASRLDRAA